MKKQLNIDDLKEIVIWDDAPKKNVYGINQLYKYIFKFKDEIELWDTHSISQTEFWWTHIRGKYDDLFQEPEEWKSIPRTRNNRKILSKKKELLRKQYGEFREKKYKEYIKTLTPTFLKKINKEHILLLIEGYNKNIPKEDFIKQHSLQKEFNSTITRIHSGSSSLVQIRFIFKNEESIDIYIRTKYQLWSPWINKEGTYINYNSKINFAIHNLLPDEGNCNKMEIIKNLKY